MKSDEVRCENCLFFDDVEPACRKNAPQLDQSARERDDWSLWPLVSEKDWCGAFKHHTEKYFWVPTDAEEEQQSTTA